MDFNASALSLFLHLSPSLPLHLSASPSLSISASLPLSASLPGSISGSGQSPFCTLTLIPLPYFSTSTGFNVGLMVLAKALFGL